MKPLVEVRDMCKIYNPGENEVRALDHVSLTIDQGEFVGIIGHFWLWKINFDEHAGMFGYTDFRILLFEWKGCLSYVR